MVQINIQENITTYYQFIGLKTLSLLRSYQHVRAIKLTVNQIPGGVFLFKLNRYLIEATTKAIDFIRTQIILLISISI